MLMDIYSYEMLFCTSAQSHDIISSARGLQGASFLLGFEYIYIVISEVVMPVLHGKAHTGTVTVYLNTDVINKPFHVNLEFVPS